MMSTAPGCRVAVVGASSLLGQELLTVLQERRFPISRLVKLETEAEEPDLPVIDLQQGVGASSEPSADLGGADFDFVFLAAAPPAASVTAELVRGAAEGRSILIDLIAGGGSPAASSGGTILSIPALERARLGQAVTLAPGQAGSRVFLASHPATIALSSLTLRLAARFKLRSATAHLFVPAAELGSRAVEELQKQTVNLLSFQKPPQTVFGGRLAFNILPRLGRTRTTPLTELERRIRFETQQYIGERAPLPALRLVQVPVFYGLAVSLFVETAGLVTLEAVASALEGDYLQVGKSSQPAPSPVDAAGGNNILIDAITRDAGSSYGVWIWAAVDGLRLAAVNAIEIAESLQPARPPGRMM